MSTAPGRKPRLPDWDEMYRLGTPPWDTGRPANELVRLIESRLIKPCPTLEIGCGTGANAIYMARKRFEITAVDSSALAVERARLRCEQMGGLVRFVLADIFEIGKKLGRFDFVFDAGFYHFIRQAELERFLDLLWWVTKPGSYYLTLAGAPDEQIEGGPPQVSEDDVRGELGRLFEVVHVLPFRFESSLRPEGFAGWSCLMRRPTIGT
jgi:SAM-dependent methyltransferase